MNQRHTRWSEFAPRCPLVDGCRTFLIHAAGSPTVRAVLPFAPGYGMETGMTIDAVRAGYRLEEYEIDLAHRATGRTLGGFVHRFRQLIDFGRVYISRR